MQKIQVPNEEKLEAVVDLVLEAARKKEVEGAFTLALSGDLGAGKTTFTQRLAGRLGVAEEVTSPTFVIMKKYELPEVESVPFTELIHVDAYRIEDIDEMRVLGFPALLQKKDTIICIEWPENIEKLIPEDAIKVSLEIEGGGRVVTID